MATLRGSLLFRVGSSSVTPRVSRPRVVRTAARASPSLYNYNIHGRHVDVTEDLETYVKDKLQGTLDKFKGAEFLEAEGGVREVDVRLMNTQAEVVVRPYRLNKELHDTYLRQGELKVIAFGNDVHNSLDEAAQILEKKLHKWTRAAPKKKDYRAL